MEADFALGPAPAVTTPASAAAMPGADKLFGVLAQHLLDRSKFRPSGRSARKNCPHLARPFPGLAKAQDSLLW